MPSPSPPLAAPFPAALRTPRDLAPLIDHTVLRPGASADEVARACDEALRYGFAGVCVREEHLALVVKLLGAQRPGGRGPRPVAVCDFPRGEGATGARAEEARRLAGEGAAEVDVVYPLPLPRARDHAAAPWRVPARAASAPARAWRS